MGSIQLRGRLGPCRGAGLVGRVPSSWLGAASCRCLNDFLHCRAFILRGAKLQLRLGNNVVGRLLL
jgi:hypothetical protein